jgi:hypothetical protein
MTPLGSAEHSAPPAASASSTATLPPWDNTTVRALFVETYKQDRRIRNLYLVDHLLQIQAQNPTWDAGKVRQELDVLMVKYDDVAKGQPDPLDASLVSGEETLQRVTLPWSGPLERFIGVPLDLAKKAFDIEGKLEAEKRFNGHTFISEMIDKYSTASRVGPPPRTALAGQMQPVSTCP